MMHSQVRALFPAETDPASESDIQRMSRRAIETAYHGIWRNPADVASRLYNYNRFPLSGRCFRQFPDEKALRQFLRLGRRGESEAPRRSTLSAGRAAASVPSLRWSQSEHWWFWGVPEAPHSAPDEFRYKIYVSPLLRDLPPVLHFVLGNLRRWGACSAKLGRKLPDLLRPDKFVLYFPRLDYAITAAQELRAAVNPADAHGVPFTFQIGPTAFVSLGFDLPASLPPDGASRSRSWRAVVTERLARVILGLERHGEGEPVTQIYGRLRKAGIDPLEWKPWSNSWFAPQRHPVDTKHGT